MFGRMVLLALVPCACGPTVVGDGAGTQAGTGAGSGSSIDGATTAPTASQTSSAGSAPDDGVDPFPEDWGLQGEECSNPNFLCATAVDCTFWACGDPMSPFDGDGCLRPSCPCDEATVCFTPAQWGSCVESGISCIPTRSSQCDCEGLGDCDGSYCLPPEEVPVPPCIELSTAAECNASNCLWFAGRDIERPRAGSCACDEGDGGVCVVPIRYTLEPTPTLYYRLDLPTTAVALDLALSPVPLGLAPCDGSGPVPVCACDPLECP